MPRRASPNEPKPPKRSRASSADARATRKKRGTNKASKVRVRMYRHGLGDCFLVTIPRNEGQPFFMLIDCGVILGTADAKQKSTDVLRDVHETTGGHLDLVVGTHEHWDHLSGFIEAEEVFRSFEIDEVWLGWTEDPKDKQGKALREGRHKALAALRLADHTLKLAGADRISPMVDNLLAFFGAAGGRSTAAALETLRASSGNVRYCDPADPPREIEGTGVRIYALGPPRDDKLIRKSRPSASNENEVYHLAALEFAADAVRALAGDNRAPPFDTKYVIPDTVLRTLPFFRAHYFDETAQVAYRRIDHAFLDAAGALALQLDAHTNNTSLALAIELPDGRVLLFAADAQIGNWYSWQQLQWEVDAVTVTGPGLIERTVLYKVGHHGSHNATLREGGLERMENLVVALIPVDRAMAKKKRWDRIPLSSLTQRLQERASEGVLASDEPVPAGLADRVRAKDDLYYEVSM